ncbi:LLM class flavin-dependent oxidoreductase [Paenibacillus sp. GCM10012307]|uniref:LLM class flavin-dependent oxidoreductase n=1 Tax=Paenibacillus roseus TaxID=2798579 RepID=A0A934MVT0_9BACL|nr:LLM class flavin-dependent oxidoreductase [Paenibacillus roseus]MBJ6362442.1 LLM class flavin-dependent oxidoreductase [Paenibacillus roseus]
MAKKLHLNAFEMNCLGHLSHGLWAHPADQRWRYKDLSYWTELAALLERGKFDTLFIADVLGIYDVYGNSKDAALRNAVQIPANDPALIVPPMAHVTNHLGFAVTSSTSYEHPFAFARRMSTLDHLTKGRIAWNIVTSYLPNAAHNFGYSEMMNHDERYELAEEFLEVVYKLWEGSWEDNAVIIDKNNRIYSDPNKVHKIEHNGKYFNVQGPHMSEPSLQRTPVLYQAGTSSRGKAFAARHAECVFVTGTDTSIMKRQIADIRRQAEEIGRDPSKIKFFTPLVAVVGETREEAEQKMKVLSSYYSHEGAMVLFGSGTGYDLAAYSDDSYLEGPRNHVQSIAERFSKNAPNPRTVGEIRQSLNHLRGTGLYVVGTATEIADQLQQWIEETDLDGFNVRQVISPGTLEDFIDLVVPELQKRGVFRKEYEEGTTFRERLYSADSGRLPDSHPAAKYRRQA